jgi:hypothetical protein
MCHGEIQRGLIVRWLVPKQNAFVIIASNSMIIHKLQRKRCFVRPVIVVVSNFTIYLLTDHMTLNVCASIRLKIMIPLRRNARRVNVPDALIANSVVLGVALVV